MWVDGSIGQGILAVMYFLPHRWLLYHPNQIMRKMTKGRMVIAAMAAQMAGVENNTHQEKRAHHYRTHINRHKRDRHCSKKSVT